MEVIDFWPKSFDEIPEQDNPAFGNDECMMVVGRYRDENREYSLVLHIKPDPIESVTSVAVFWRHDRAMQFAADFKP